MHDEGIQAEDAERGFHDDLGRAEPVLQLAAIEEHLEGAEAETEKGEAQDVERHLPGLRLGHEGHHAQEGQNAHRQVDVEDPAPAVEFRQIAAQGRAQDRANHDAHAPDRHGLAMLFVRIGIEQHGLRQGYEGRAEDALERAEQDHLLQRRRSAAEHGDQGEPADGHQEQALAAEAAFEESGGRSHDRRRHDIGGQDPGNLILGGTQGTLHMGQRHIGDGGVEGLHDGGQHHRDRDVAAMGCSLSAPEQRHG